MATNHDDRRGAARRVAGFHPRGGTFPQGRGSARHTLCAAIALLALAGCAPHAATTPRETRYDATAPKPIQPRDRLERLALDRGPDLKLIDRLTEERTRIEESHRAPLPALSSDARISDEVVLLDDADPFPPAQRLAQRDATIFVALLRSTYRTHEPEEVLAAVQPFLDLQQRLVSVRPDFALHERAAQAYAALREQRQQLVISHVFDYLLIRDWLSADADDGTILLGAALPARPRTGEIDRGFAGIPGASIELIVRRDAPCRSPADLRGARLALAANDAHGPGAFLTKIMRDAGAALDQPFFASVTLRRYPKDALLDVLKGRADVACVDQGCVAAMDNYYGVLQRLRTLAVSPRMNFDVLFCSVGSLRTHRTEIELTQRQLLTLRKDPEGQEVLFFFDIDSWRYATDDDLAPAIEQFENFVIFHDHTPADLRPLLDPAAPVDRRTYDRFGDE